MPSPVSISKTEASIETMFVRFLCESMTPFGCPVVPEVKMSEATAFGETRAVDDVSLDVASGEFVAIVGSSGSGKTTLLRLANRLIDADRGTITVEGEDVRAVDPVSLRRRIGYVFQSGGLFPHMSVGDNIGITPKLLGTPAAETAARVGSGSVERKVAALRSDERSPAGA